MNVIEQLTRGFSAESRVFETALVEIGTTQYKEVEPHQLDMSCARGWKQGSIVLPGIVVYGQKTGFNYTHDFAQAVRGSGRPLPMAVLVVDGHNININFRNTNTPSEVCFQNQRVIGENLGRLGDHILAYRETLIDRYDGEPIAAVRTIFGS